MKEKSLCHYTLANASLRSTFFALLVLFASIALPSFAQQAKRPNIVIFIADDLGYTDIEPYGNKVVKTPNLTALAAQSLLFKNSFANTPTCIPSRASFFSGLMPLRNGSHANNAKGFPVSECKPGVKTLPHYLSAIGYNVAHAGKRHFGPLSVFPFEFIANSEVREPGYENREGLFTDLNTTVVEQWLAAQKGTEPFCLVVCDNSPHVIWPEKPTYDKNAVDVPPNAIATDEYKYMRSRYYTDVTKMDNNVGRVMKSLQQNGLDKNTVFIFTSDQGAQFPFAKWNLYDAGVRTPLLIKWPGKIKPGTTDAMVAHIDMLPTILRLAGAPMPDSLDGKSYMEVIISGKKEHETEIFLTHSQDGLMNISPMRAIRTAKYKYILNLSPEYTYHTHIDGARDHDGGALYWISWEKLARTNLAAQSVIDHYYTRPKEELYDVENDAYEQHNLAPDPAYASVLNDLRQRLTNYRLLQNDTITGPILNIQTNWQSEGKK